MEPSTNRDWYREQVAQAALRQVEHDRAVAEVERMLRTDR